MITGLGGVIDTDGPVGVVAVFSDGAVSRQNSIKIKIFPNTFITNIIKSKPKDTVANFTKTVSHDWSSRNRKFKFEFVAMCFCILKVSLFGKVKRKYSIVAVNLAVADVTADCVGAGAVVVKVAAV